MAFGFSPKYIETFQVHDLTNTQLLALAIGVVEKLEWNIGAQDKTKFLAYTKFSMSSWSEEIRIEIEDKTIKIKSECTGSQILDWGKNKKNVKLFIDTFNAEKIRFTPSELDSKFLEIENNIDSINVQGLDNSPLSQKEKVSSIISFFKPTEGYYITPILLSINIIIFILMVVSGVNVFQPSNESLLLWGANFRPLTLDGEWWRLLSSCFLHIGVFHLLMNMFALAYIGMMLEPYLGKARFLSAYLLTGITASVISLYWNDLTISAGASGAIFGMYGVFLALLTTSLIEKSARNSLITSIVVFVGYNLMNGFKGGVDNAAHIGGLVSGLIVGYSFYFSLVKPNTVKLKQLTIGVLTILVLSLSITILTTTSNSIKQYQIEMDRFVALEKIAIGLYSLPESTSVDDYLYEIEVNGIENWNKSLKLLDRVDQLDLSEELKSRNLKLRDYCNLRIKNYNLIYNAISEDSDAYTEKIDKVTTELEQLMTELEEG